MTRSFGSTPFDRRTVLKSAGVLAAAGILPISHQARAQEATKSAVVYGRAPYTTWTGIRFWTNAGVLSRLLWEPLFDPDDELLPVSALAESWEVVSSSLVRVTLREGLVWSDGAPLTTDDVVFSFNLTFNGDLNGLTATEIATIAGGDEVRAGTATELSGVRAIDERVFEIETAVPDTTILRTLATRWWAPIPKHIYEGVAGADLLASEAMREPSVVSGPFKFDRLEPDSWYELSANDNYWRGRPHLDEVTFVFGNIGDHVAQASQEQFHFSVYQNIPDTAHAIAEIPAYTVTEVEYIQSYRIQFNTRLPQFADPRFRKAVAYALDRDTLTQQIYRGNASPVLSDFQGNLLDPAAEIYGYDPERARALLEEIGWDSDQTVYIERQAVAAGATPDPILEAENAAYALWLGEVGIKLEVRLHPDSATYNNFTLPAQADPQFHCFENPHRRYDMYGALEMKNYLYSTPGNFAYWANEEADNLVSQAQATADNDEYIAIGQELSILVAEECPYIPTKAVNIAVAAHNTFTGYSTFGEYYYAYKAPYDWDLTV